MGASAGAIRAGKAAVELGLNDGPLRAGLKRAEALIRKFGAGINAVGTKLKGIGSGLTSFGAKLGAIGGAVKAPMLLAAKLFADTGSELADMSVRTGLSVEALSQLGHAANMTGASLEDVETGAKTANRALADAAEGSAEAQAKFLALGLSVEKLAKLSPDQRFQAILMAIARLPDPAQRAAAAMELLGRSGTKLLPLAADFNALTREARRFGLVMSKEDAEAADKLGDAMDLLQAVLKRTAVSIGSALAPEITELAGKLATAGAKAIEFIAANKPLVVSIAKIAGAVVAAGAAFITIGPAITAIGTLFVGMTTAAGGLVAALGLVLSPFGLIATAALAATGALVDFRAIGGQALAWLGERFNELKATAVAAFQGIANALKAGDLKLAGQVLWAALKVEWIKGTTALKGLWADLSAGAVTAFHAIGYAAQGVFVDLWAAMQSGFVGALGVLRDAWTGLMGFFEKGFNSIIAEVFKGFELAKATVLGGDPTAAIQAIDQDTAAKNRAVDQRTAATIQGRQPARQQQLADIEADRQAERDRLADRQRIEADARLAAARAGLDGPNAELAAALAEFERLKEEAGGRAAGAGGVAGLGKRLPADFTPEGLDRAMQSASRKIETKGTFSAAAIRGLTAGDTVADQQLTELQQIKRATTSTDNRLRRGGPVWGA